MRLFIVKNKLVIIFNVWVLVYQDYTKHIFAVSIHDLHTDADIDVQYRPCSYVSLRLGHRQTRTYACHAHTARHTRTVSHVLTAETTWP